MQEVQTHIFEDQGSQTTHASDPNKIPINFYTNLLSEISGSLCEIINAYRQYGTVVFLVDPSGPKSSSLSYVLGRGLSCKYEAELADLQSRDRVKGSWTADAMADKSLHVGQCTALKGESSIHVFHVLRWHTAPLQADMK